MFDRLLPDVRAVSSFEIDYKAYKRKGIRGLIYDIDNTLVEHDADADERAVKLFGELTRMGFSIVFLSNNKEERVKRFRDGLAAGGVNVDNVFYLHKAGKPKPSGYLKAMKMMGTDKSSTLFIGDQLFTDIYGANLSHIDNILVKQIAKHEEIQIVLKRKLEAPILWRFKKRFKLRARFNGVVLAGFNHEMLKNVARELANCWDFHVTLYEGNKTFYKRSIVCLDAVNAGDVGEDEFKKCAAVIMIDDGMISGEAYDKLCSLSDCFIMKRDKTAYEIAREIIENCF